MKWNFATALLLSISFHAQAQIVTTQDTTFAALAGGGFLIYRSQSELNSMNRQFSQEIARIAQGVVGNEAEYNRLMGEAATYEAPQAKINSVSLYEGRFGVAADYDTHADNTQLLRDTKFRLQQDGAQRLIQALRSDSRFSSGAIIEVSIQRVRGTQDGRIVLNGEEKIRGSFEQVAKNLADLASKQDPSSPVNSIVKVSGTYTEMLPPDVARASQLKAQAAAVKSSSGSVKNNAAEQRIAADFRLAERLKVLKRMRSVGIGIIGFGLLVGGIRSAFAQQVMDLSESCLSDEALNTQTVAMSLSRGISEQRVRAELLEICSQ